MQEREVRDYMEDQNKDFLFYLDFHIQKKVTEILALNTKMDEAKD